jgi:hypothetical protein
MSALSSKLDREIKSLSKTISGYQTGGNKNGRLNMAKKLADGFAGKYNKLYNVSTVIPNLSKENIGSMLINKVTAGSLTSASIPNLKVMAARHVLRNVGKFFSRGSANNVPPSMRGTARGRVAQAANSFKSGISRAFKSIFRRK